MIPKDESAILKRFEKIAIHNDPIDQSLYSKYDVKRGLRNANGTGVLVGLTRIGDVVGYDIKDGQKIAIPGRLVYRGYNVEDLIKDAEKTAMAKILWAKKALVFLPALKPVILSPLF